jgi:hypothetical protein
MQPGGGIVIWIMLAVLGVPIWLVVGGLLAALGNRRLVRRAPDAFPCKLRVSSAGDPIGGWGRGTASGRWVHDVLLVSKGLALARSDALPVHDLQGSVTRSVDVKFRSGHPVSIRLSLDDGSTVEVAAPVSSAHLLSGPFLAFEAKRVEEAPS